MAAHSNPFSMAILVQHIQNIADATTRAVGMAVIEATELAYSDAVKAAKANFNNTPGRTRTGQLMNAIYRGFNKDTGEGFIGVRSPYGAIQEFGGTVVPKNARHLWVKNYIGVDGRFKRWLPRDFMSAMASDKRFSIFTNPHTQKLIAAFSTGKAGTAQTQALFALVGKVELPERPYVRPAVKQAYDKLPLLMAKHVQQEGSK